MTSDYPTLSIDAYLLEAKSYQISSRSDLKRRSLSLFEEVGLVPTRRRRTRRITTRWRKEEVYSLMEFHLTATECHLPYGITGPATRHKWAHPALTPAIQAGTWFTYPGGMEGWVDLGVLLHTEMVYPPAWRSPIQVLTGPSVEMSSDMRSVPDPTTQSLSDCKR